MDTKTYLDLLAKQREMMTKECAYAILEQQRLHGIVVEKQRIKDELEGKWYSLFTAGCQQLFEQYPEIKKSLPETEIKAEAIHTIVKSIKTQEYQDVTSKMKTIPKLNDVLKKSPK